MSPLHRRPVMMQPYQADSHATPDLDPAARIELAHVSAQILVNAARQQSATVKPQAAGEPLVAEGDQAAEQAQSTVETPAAEGRQEAAEPPTADKPQAGVEPQAADGPARRQVPVQNIKDDRAGAEPGFSPDQADRDQLRDRLVNLASDYGIDELADLWASRPGDTLPGVLWRLYVLREGIRRAPGAMARTFDEGRRHAPVDEAVAGVAAPYGTREVSDFADAVLAGVFTGDLAVALERAGAFCEVCATGGAILADEQQVGADTQAAAEANVHLAAQMQRTGSQLTHAASLWRSGDLT